MEKLENELMTIGTLAKTAGVGVETVRFYQRKGLLEKPSPVSGFRKYSEADVQKIKFIKRVQELGFSLKGAQELLNLTGSCQETRPLLAKITHEKIKEVEQKIADLNNMVESLRQFHQSCGSNTLINVHCNLLECFEGNGNAMKNRKRKTK